MATALQLWSRARERGDHGRSADAAALCERALNSLTDDDPDDGFDRLNSQRRSLHARILITLSYHRAELGHLPDAFRMLDAAAKIDSEARPYVEASRGMLLVRTGRPDAALHHFDLAVADLQGRPTASDPLDVARTMLNRGLLHMTAGRLTAALSDTAEAREILATAARTDSVEFMAAHNLGYIRFLQGDLPGALNTMSAAERIGPASVGVPALDRSRVLLAAGLVSEAREFADRALADFTANRATADLADALQVRAEIDLAMGNPGAARWAARRAARIAARRGNERAATVAEVIELRADALRRRTSLGSAAAQRNGAVRAARRAGELAGRLSAMGLTEDALAARLLQVEAQLDAGTAPGPRSASAGPRVAAAVGETERAAVATGERSGNLAIRLHARVLSARLEIAAGAPAAGLTHVRRGLDDLARFQARSGHRTCSPARPCTDASSVRWACAQRSGPALPQRFCSGWNGRGRSPPGWPLSARRPTRRWPPTSDRCGWRSTGRGRRRWPVAGTPRWNIASPSCVTASGPGRGPRVDPVLSIGRSP